MCWLKKWLFVLIFVTFVAESSSTPPLDIASFRTAVLATCPQITSLDLPSDYRLTTSALKPLQVSVALNLLRFVEINDLSQTLSLFANFYFYWPYNCKINCEVFLPATFGKNASDCKNSALMDLLYFSVSSDKAWIPVLVHKNAVHEPQIIKKLSGGVSIQAFSSKGVASFWQAVGRIDSACNFAFKRFPFDTLNCSLFFDSQYLIEEVAFDIYSFMVDNTVDSFIGDTDMWSLVNLTSEAIPINQFQDGALYYRLEFTIVFQRRYQYYVSNIFIPTEILYIVQLCGLILPGHMPDRPMFSATLVLAYIFLLSIVQAQIPATSEMVYLVQLVTIKLICGVVLTIYMLIVPALPHADLPSPVDKSKRAKRSHTVFLCLTYRKLDILVGLVLSAAVIIADFVFYGLMINASG